MLPVSERISTALAPYLVPQKGWETKNHIIIFMLEGLEDFFLGIHFSFLRNTYPAHRKCFIPVT